LGYYTTYKLECPAAGRELGWEIAAEMERYETDYGKLSSFVGGYGESIKWYDHESDIKAFSKRFPDVVFTLHGEGEESGDIWVKYFKDGKMQKVEAQIVFAPFDEGQLK
jgi:hypothetical protein